MSCWTDAGKCSSCKHAGMDMDLDPYCIHPMVIKDYQHGLYLNQAIEKYCTSELKLYEIR